MNRYSSTSSGVPIDGSPPSESWLFAQAILGNPIPDPHAATRRLREEREQLARLAEISPRHADELRKLESAEAEARRKRDVLVWAAKISTEAEAKLRALLREEAEIREAQRRWEQYYENYLARLAEWDEADHPRQPKGTPDGGQWSSKGGGSASRSATTASSPFRTADYRAGQSTVQLAAFAAAPPTTWPTTGSASALLPKVGSGAAAGAGAAAGIGAGAFLGGLGNASMAAYWSRVPGTQAMPTIWVYELEKRVRAGTLPRDDAIHIFNTAVLGAEAQGFKPTGGTLSDVHNSATDFLAQAEAVYFARKKQKAAETAKNENADSAAAKPERVTGEALDNARKKFNGMKPALWKEEATKNSEKYSPDQLDDMRRGDAPKGSDGKRMEIHHKKPLSEGGTNTLDNFEFTTQTDHRLGPNLKKNHPNLPRGPRP